MTKQRDVRRMTADNLVLWQGDASEVGAWRSNAADGATARLSTDAGALRFDFALAGHGAWAIARRELTAELPAHYVAVIGLRGAGATPVQLQLQLKLVDPSGANVWWWRVPYFVPAQTPPRLVLRKATLEFAWGPLSGGDPHQIGAVELALASDTGASGMLWIDALRIEARDPAETQPQVQTARASSAAPDHGPQCALEPNDTPWCPDPSDTQPWLELDLGRTAEFGGVVVDFAEDAVPCRLLASDDGQQWTELASSPTAGGRRRWLRSADAEARYARVQFDPTPTPAVVHADVVPLELAVSPARFVTAKARRAPRGRFPRHLLNEQAYWALVGAEGDAHKGLLSEDGALEVDAQSFTLEPFLWADGRFLTWADVHTEQSLADDHLPVASVEWHTDDLRLRLTAFATGTAGKATLLARYAVESLRRGTRNVRLFVAVRPFQVNPAWQSLNIVGGVAPITELACERDSVMVNGTRRVVALTPPDAVGAAASDHGLAALADGHAPDAARVDDPVGFAEAALAFDLTLEAGEVEMIDVAVPWDDASPQPPRGMPRADAAAWADARLAETIAHWRDRLARVPIALPRGAARMNDALRASLGWILINREGPRIQPGSRCYRRSWIRDGTLTGTALAEMGFTDELRAFLRWYAPYQLPDGRVPCAVDHRGIDQAVEHDSHGQLIWGVVELFHLTGDRAFLNELWPHVRAAVGAIEQLRAQRTTEAYRTTPCFGLLPESISHEGYASHPVHSYWDDFFAVRALADAADAAAVLGDAAEAARIGAVRDAMSADLRASVARAIAEHGIDFIPGSVELADFDPTSTAIAFDPCSVTALLPAAALRHTFERYWAELEARRRGQAPNEAYAPYEVRNAAALLMLGQRERAVELLDWLVADQRLSEWREWPEVTWLDRRAPRFFGDLPHGWVASSFVRSVRRLIAYERRDDGVLVLAAGVPESWVREAPGVRAHGLATHYGSLDFTICADRADRVRVTLGGNAKPPGGFVIVSPFAQPLRGATVGGRAHPVSAGQVLVRERVSEVHLLY